MAFWAVGFVEATGYVCKKQHFNVCLEASSTHNVSKTCGNIDFSVISKPKKNSYHCTSVLNVSFFRFYFGFFKMQHDVLSRELRVQNLLLCAIIHKKGAGMESCRNVIFKTTFMHTKTTKMGKKIRFFHCETIESFSCSLSSNFLPQQMVVGGTGHTCRGKKKRRNPGDSIAV